MRRALIIVAVPALVIGAASAAFALSSDEGTAEPTAALQTPDEPVEEDTAPPGPCFRGFDGRGFGGFDLPGLLGMTREELHDALADGKTIQDLAAENGVDLVAAFTEAAEERIAAAEAEGRITPEQAAELRQRLQERAEAFADGEHFGLRGPRGHFRGFGAPNNGADAQGTSIST
jgi:hypothetical protein